MRDLGTGGTVVSASGCIFQTGELMAGEEDVAQSGTHGPFIGGLETVLNGQRRGFATGVTRLTTLLRPCRVRGGDLEKPGFQKREALT